MEVGPVRIAERVEPLIPDDGRHHVEQVVVGLPSPPPRADCALPTAQVSRPARRRPVNVRPLSLRRPGRAACPARTAGVLGFLGPPTLAYFTFTFTFLLEGFTNQIGDVRLRFGSRSEHRAVLTAAAEMGDATGHAIALALHTGLRRGELLGLTWGRVDLDGARPTARIEAQVTPKGGYEETLKTRRSRRVLVLGAEAVAVLRRAQQRQRFAVLAAEDGWDNRYDLVFTDAVGGALQPDGFTKAVNRLTLRVLGRSVHPHELRHTTASLMAAAAITPKVASERLGHDVMMLLGTYTHTMDDQHDRAAEALDVLLTGEGRP